MPFFVSCAPGNLPIIGQLLNVLWHRWDGQALQ